MDEGATGEMGVLIVCSIEVFVGDGGEVEPGLFVCKEVGLKGCGVLVRGCKRYDAVIAMAVLVLSAFRTSISLAGPAEAIQTKINRITNRPVTPSACQ